MHLKLLRRSKFIAGSLWKCNERLRLYHSKYLSEFQCHCSVDTKQINPVKERNLNTRFYSWFSGQGNNRFQRSVNDAEKLVGYTTTYNSWKYLFDEEPATFIGLARKVVGSGHPLLQTVRDILSQDPYSINHLGGLWVLLVSQAAGVNTNFDVEGNFIRGIHNKQRVLAETTELINTAFLIHRNMLDLSVDAAYNSEDKENKTLEFGNKLFILGGDFLLSKASLELAKLENTEVVGMIGQSIGDMAEGATLEDITEDISEWTLETWQDYIFLLRGSLMANSCKSSATLMSHSQIAGDSAYNFGKNLVLAQHCIDDIECFNNDKQLIKRTNYVLISALQNNHELNAHVEQLADWKNLDGVRDLKRLISEHQSTVIEEARAACRSYIDVCLQNIKIFPHADTVRTIQSILHNMLEQRD